MPTDYFPLIQRAVQSLSPNSPQTRNALYEKARAALLRQFHNADPPVTESQIARECSLLEEAIRRVEHDYDEAAFVPPPVSTDDAPVNSSDAPVTESQPEPRAAADNSDTPPPVTEAAGSEKAEPGEPPDSTSVVAERKTDAKRPRAPRRSTHGGQAGRYGLMAIAALAIIAGGVSAVYFTHSGETTAQNNIQPTQTNTEPAAPSAPPEIAKIDERPENASPTTQTPPASQPVTGQQAQQGNSAPSPLIRPPASQMPEGQRARFIEEDPSVADKARIFDGKVSWHTESQPSGNSAPMDIVVIGSLDIPERRLKATLTLRHNNDPALPAAYVMQIQLDVPADYPNGEVDAIKGLAVSDDPEKDGDLLDGALMKVSTGTFLFGILDPPDEKGREAKLLTNYSWFRLMFVFKNGRKAILTFEKGAEGRKIMQEAMQMWSPSTTVPQQ